MRQKEVGGNPVVFFCLSRHPRGTYSWKAAVAVEAQPLSGAYRHLGVAGRVVRTHGLPAALTLRRCRGWYEVGLYLEDYRVILLPRRRAIKPRVPCPGSDSIPERH